MKGKQQDYRVEKYIRYGIRKYSFGAASGSYCGWTHVPRKWSCISN